MTTWLTATPLAIAIVAATSLPARAQTLPSEPIVFGDGRLTIGGDAAVSCAPQDPGFFNYTDYQHSTLRPALNSVGFMTPEQSRQSGNLNTARTCGYHDHELFGDPKWQGKIIIQ
jgi:hypothetical protein